MTFYHLTIFNVCVGNDLGAELEESGLSETQHSEPTVPLEVPGASDGAKSSDDSMRAQSCLPRSGVLINNHISCKLLLFVELNLTQC